MAIDALSAMKRASTLGVGVSTGCTALGVGSGLWLASEEYELAKSSLVIVTEAKFLAVRDVDCEGLLGVIEGESDAGRCWY